MTAYTLSVVLLIPAAHQAEINALAEEAGYGQENITRPLLHTDGSEWFGGHTWAAPAFLTDLGSAPPSEALAALVMSVREGGEPLEHWTETLEANGLEAVKVIPQAGPLDQFDAYKTELEQS